MKEIVIVTPHLGNGGAERVLSELMTEWTKMGIKVSVVQTNANRYGNDYPFSRDVEMINLQTTKGRFRRMRQVMELTRILKARKNTVVVSFVNTAILICGLTSFFVDNKFIFSERCDPDRTPNHKIQRMVRDQIFRRADQCVFQTQMARAHFPKAVQNKSVIIHNPINPYLPKPYEGKRSKTIITAAQLVDQKNLPMLINAFALFHADFPDYKLEIYGRGAKEQELKMLIKEKGVESCAFLKGFADDIYSKMRDCAMYVSSSDYEGISNSMLEALGLGIPTICTDCPAGGAREMIDNGENGLLVPVGDVMALNQAMRKIATNPCLSDSLSKNAIKIREKLLISRIAKEWLTIMDIGIQE